MRRIEGAYSLVIMTRDQLIARPRPDGRAAALHRPHERKRLGNRLRIVRPRAPWHGAWTARSSPARWCIVDAEGPRSFFPVHPPAEARHLHLRIHLLRPPRQRPRRRTRSTAPAKRWARSSPANTRSRPTSSSACPIRRRPPRSATRAKPASPTARRSSRTATSAGRSSSPTSASARPASASSSTLSPTSSATSA